MRRPRAFAAVMASSSSKVARGLTLLCSSAATITGLPEAAAISSSSPSGVPLPLVIMNTPRPASPRHPASARSSAWSARREGIGMPP